MNLLSLVTIFLLAVPQFSIATVKSAVSCKALLARASKKLDGVAGWGTKLLPPTAFQNNRRYQQNMNLIINSDSTVITPYWVAPGHSLRGKFDSLLTEWNGYLARSILLDPRKYSVVKNGIDHHLNLLELRSSGTEANNYFYELAGYAYRKRTGKIAKRPQLLFFANPETGLFPYGGTSGRSAEMSIRYTQKPQETLDHYLVPSPQSKYLGDIPPSELKRLIKLEDEAIGFIRKQVKNENLEIGGIILEPISVSHGIHFYRKEFLIRLRELADELHIPIMADEIFTGGGRTGEFWAFQHYEGFFPDLISFGKGLELKGVGWIKRQPVDNEGKRNGHLVWDFPRFNPHVNTDPSKWSYDNMRLDNTSVSTAAEVSRAIVVMETITSENLVASAKTNGNLILTEARTYAAQVNIPPEEIQGIGLVFNFSKHVDQFFTPGAVANYHGRITPYLTTTQNDWPSYPRSN